MDRETLATLKRMIGPVTLRGAVTPERASSLASLNCEISRFHAALAVAQRLLERCGEVDAGIERELLVRARQLMALREGMSRAPECAASTGA